MARRERPVDLSARRLSRRRLLRGGLLGVGGLAAAALLGCTQDEDPAPPRVASRPADPTSTPSPEPTAQPEPRPLVPRRQRLTVTPEPYSRGAPRAVIGHPDLPFPYQYPEPVGLTPELGGTLLVGSTIDVESMDPLNASEGGSVTFPNMVYNRLLGMESGPRKRPWSIDLERELASAWEVSPDGLTLTFHLRANVHWQNVPPLDGREFVAEDVRFAFDRYRLGAGPHSTYWASVGAIDAPHPLTLNVHMARVTADLLFVPLASRYQPIYPRELVDRETIATQAVGTGPMIMVDAAKGSHATFGRNPDYFEHHVLLDGVEFRVLRDREERAAAFRTGRLDYAHDLVAHSDQMEALLQTNPDVQINLSPVVGGQALGLNLSNPTFADERVRQAITLALNPYLMADRVYRSVAEVLPLHPWTFALWEEPAAWWSEDLGPWFGRHNPDLAMQLLQAAGAEGLSFEAIYHDGGDTTLVTITEMAVEQLAAVGITMQPRSLAQADFDEIWRSGDLAEASVSADIPAGFDADHFFYHLVHSQSPKNLWRLDDPQVDAWAEAQQVELDPEARREIHRTMWEYFLDKMFWPPLPTPIGFEVYQPWVRGIRFGGILGTNSFFDLGDQIAGAWIDPDNDWGRK